MLWNRVSYGEPIPQLHNHAFVHTPICTRSTTVTWMRNGNFFAGYFGEKLKSLLLITEYYPTVSSGIKKLQVLKTTQSSFVNFVDDEYRTLPDQKDRVFSTSVDCSWEYRKIPDIDYDKSWEMVKLCILRNFAGDLDCGTPSPSVQNTLYMSEKDALEKVPAINSIEMTMPNKHYIDFDFSKLQGLEGGNEDTRVFLPLEKPSGVIYGKLERKPNKL